MRFTTAVNVCGHTWFKIYFLKKQHGYEIKNNIFTSFFGTTKLCAE